MGIFRAQLKLVRFKQKRMLNIGFTYQYIKKKETEGCMRKSYDTRKETN